MKPIKEECFPSVTVLKTFIWICEERLTTGTSPAPPRHATPTYGDPAHRDPAPPPMRLRLLTHGRAARRRVCLSIPVCSDRRSRAVVRIQTRFRQQLGEWEGTLGRRAAIRPTFPFPAQRAVVRAWQWRRTHAYPGSSIFHPCYGNIDIGSQAADIGYVMMQLKQEPFHYYWQECQAPPSHSRRQI